MTHKKLYLIDLYLNFFSLIRYTFLTLYLSIFFRYLQIIKKKIEKIEKIELTPSETLELCIPV